MSDCFLCCLSYEVFLFMNERYLRSPLNYIGGKYKILNQILPRFPNDIDTFVDLFCGGLNVSINVNAPHILANDKLAPLIDMYQYFKETSIDDILSYIEKTIKELAELKGNISFKNILNSGDYRV